jgi:hypothetical protein
MEIESRVVVARGWGKEELGKVFGGQGDVVSQDKKFLNSHILLEECEYSLLQYMYLKLVKMVNFI